jgi:hypothetical protein
MKKYIKIILVMAVVVGAAGAFAAIPMLRAHLTKHAPVKENAEPVLDKKELAILQEVSAMQHKMDSLTVFTITGTINARDLADSSNQMHTDFLYSRKGDDSYYKLGEQEMIGTADAYISVTHDIKKILLAPPHENSGPMQTKMELDPAVIAREGYHVSKTQLGRLQQILLRCDNHISCREYALIIDSSGQVVQTHMRLTDHSAPADHQKDKLVDVKINRWQPGVAREDLMKAALYVTSKNGEVKPAAALSEYQIISSH